LALTNDFTMTMYTALVQNLEQWSCYAVFMDTPSQSTKYLTLG